MIGVLTRFVIERYRMSLLYRGIEGRPVRDGDETGP
jgi:hypothetical protein